MGKYDHTTLLIPEEDKQRLEIIAREFGYMQTRGAGTGTLGSISAFICAIARKEVEIVKPNEHDNDPASMGQVNV